VEEKRKSSGEREKHSAANFETSHTKKEKAFL